MSCDHRGHPLIAVPLLTLSRPEFPMVLVANKADLEGERVVSIQDGESLALELKVQSITY